MEIQILEVDTLRSLNTIKVMEERQDEDPFIKEEIFKIEEEKPSEFHLGEHSSLWFHKRICVPDIPEIKKLDTSGGT